MVYPRIIPKMDIKGQNLVKGVHLEGLRVLGKPEEFALNYYQQGADELIFQDVVASLYQRNNILDIIKRTAKNIFIPLTVGGGVRTLQDIRNLLLAGADKVAINTAAVKDPSFINTAARTFGSSTIVVSIEAIKQSNGNYFAYTDNGREYTGLEIKSWAKEVEERGAGEILFTSIDNEGTGKGISSEFLNTLSRTSKVPIIIHGGIGNYQHVIDIFKSSHIRAVGIASMLHYGLINNNLMNGSYENEGNTDFLKQNRIFNKFGSCQLKELKETLKDNRISIRE
jgi:imidazole glycerol-phosphate synthase subunit HisF